MENANNKPKKRYTTFALNERQDAMLKDIQYEIGADTIRQTIADCISFRHKKLFPQYKATALSALTSPEEDADAVAQRQLAKKKAINDSKERAAYEERVAICNTLGGVLSNDTNGNEVCTWYSYNHTQRYEQVSPVEMMNEDMIKNQFYPSKDEVLKHFPELQ